MEDDVQVAIEGTTYSLMEPPPSDTQLVLVQRAKLLSVIDLKIFVEDLGRVGSCIRLAYNGVTAAGSKFTELRIEFRDLGYDVIKLCDKSAFTLDKYIRACETVLDNLKTTHGYLLDNFEDMALEKLASVSELAGEMATGAQELHKDFDQVKLKAQDVAKMTKQTHEQQAVLVEEMKREELELRMKQKQQEIELTKARQEEEHAEEMIREYDMREDQAIKSLGDEDIVLAGMVNELTSQFLGTRMLGEDLKTKVQKIRMCKEKKSEALNRREKQGSMRREVYQKLTDFSVEIGRCASEKKMADAAVDTLHMAMDGLLMLADILKQASLFWELMQEHCNGLGEDQMKQTVDKAMKFDNSKRRKLWISLGFKRKAVCFYASWVAHRDVCKECMLAIQETQRDLYRYSIEKPTYEEAAANVKTLAAKFYSDLREAIARQEFETKEQIRRLHGETA